MGVKRESGTYQMLMHAYMIKMSALASHALLALPGQNTIACESDRSSKRAIPCNVDISSYQFDALDQISLDHRHH